jgi:hypothetical protein
MSGGSWNYVCFQVQEAADRLFNEKDPLRRALAPKVKILAEALHKIELVDSGDSSPPKDSDAIKAFLGDKTDELIMEVLIDDARKLIEEMKKLGA